MEKTFRTTIASPIGDIEIAGTEKEICSVEFARGKKRATSGSPEVSPAVAKCAAQLREYFSGKRRIFELDLRLSGSDFQIEVWRRLLTIGFGETVTYGEIAAAIGRPSASRAVGNANRLNPIAVIIPCHRIIGGSGSLVGYGGGLWRKEWLLEHEGSSRTKPAPGTRRRKPSELV